MHAFIFHIDLDAFFASVEQVLNPRLRGRPVIVGGSPHGRGVVASASYEARRFGVKVAMPLHQAYSLCPQAVFLSGHFQHYSNASAKVMNIFREFTPAVEVGSLDEAYLDFTGFARLYGGKVSSRGADDKWLLNLAQEIRQKVKERTGLSVSIGIGTSKLIAKVASSLAKPAGIILVKPGYEEAFLAPLKISRLPGIGKATQEKLERFNIKRIGDLRRLPRDILEASFGVYGAMLYERCRGRDETEVVTQGDGCKSISRETTFDEDTMDRGYIEGMLYYLTERAARDLRQMGMKARTVSVKIRYCDFDTHTASKSLLQPTDRDFDFQKIVLKLLDKLFTRRVRMRLVGVAISGLSRPHSFQPTFFSKENFHRRDGLYDSLDRIRSRFGFSAIISGRAINLLGELKRDFYGFRLRTPSLTR